MMAWVRDKRKLANYVFQVVILIVPTLCVGTQPGTLRVPFESWNAERPKRRSHAERGNDQNSSPGMQKAPSQGQGFSIKADA